MNDSTRISKDPEREKNSGWIFFYTFLREALDKDREIGGSENQGYHFIAREICLLYDGFFSFAVVRQSLLLNYATSTRTGKRLFLLQLAGSFKEIAYTVLICNG